MSDIYLRRVNTTGSHPFWLLAVPNQLRSVPLSDDNVRSIIDQFVAQGGELPCDAPKQRKRTKEAVSHAS